MPRTVLFLCTGNYYRSRFAEFLFNALAAEAKLPWVAESRGLAVEMAAGMPGPMSPLTIDGLIQRGVTPRPPVRYPLACSDDDIRSAEIVIALKEAEHKPFLQKRHPSVCDKARFWHIHDLDGAKPQEALAELEREVRALVESLRTAE